MTQDAGIDILAEIADMGIIPGIERTSKPNEVMQFLKRYLEENLEQLKALKMTDNPRISALDNMEKEIVEAIWAKYSQAFDRERAVVDIITRDHGLFKLAEIGLLCEVIKKLTK